MNVTSKKLNLLIFFVFFVVTQSIGQNLDTVKIIKDIRDKYKRIINSDISPQIIYIDPEGIFDIYEGDTTELENPFDGGTVEIYRGNDNNIRLIRSSEKYTAAVNWSNEDNFYFSKNELFFYYSTCKSSLPLHEEQCNFLYGIQEQRVYFHKGNVIRHLTKTIDGCEGFEVLGNKIDYVKNKYKSNFKSIGEVIQSGLEDIRNSHDIK